MKKVVLFFSLFLCFFTTSYSFAQNNKGNLDNNYNNVAQRDNNYQSQGEQAFYGANNSDACALTERPVGDCYSLYYKYEPCYYNKWHCKYVPQFIQKKHCRMVPQYYEKTYCRYIPQYYSKISCHQVPKYCYTTNCRYVPKYTCERCCKHAPKYYYKHTSRPICGTPCAPAACALRCEDAR